MGAWERFDGKLTGVEEAPEPFRRVLASALGATETVRLLVFDPSYVGVRRAAEARAAGAEMA